MIIIIHSAPRKKLRNSQFGDWRYAHDVISVSVPNDIPPQHQLAIGIHELIEAFLCQKNGITDVTVCKFDGIFEQERIKGKHSDTAEPGDDPRSPYREEHQMATHVERATVHALGMLWDAYSKALE